MEGLAPETLAEILINLPYRSLLRAMRVCKRWKGVMDGDRNLRVAMFKAADTSILRRELDPGVAGEGAMPGHFSPPPVEMLHPALVNKIRYRFGDPVSSASLLPYGRALARCSILHDLACIPATKCMSILIMQTDSMPPCIIDAKAENPNGVCIGDILEAMQQVPQQNQHVLRMSSLRDRTFLVDFAEAVWRGTVVEAKMFLPMNRPPVGLAGLVATRWFRDDQAEDPEDERLRGELLGSNLLLPAWKWTHLIAPF